MRKLRFDLDLIPSWLGEPEHALETLARDVAGALNNGHLALAFHETQLVEQGSEPAIGVKRIAPLHFTHETIIASLHLGGGAFVFVGVQENLVRFTDDSPQGGREVLA